jgi:hypothetical protein
MADADSDVLFPERTVLLSQIDACAALLAGGSGLPGTGSSCSTR